MGPGKWHKFGKWIVHRSIDPWVIKKKIDRNSKKNKFHPTFDGSIFFVSAEMDQLFLLLDLDQSVTSLGSSSS
jgi:hypothetical protein